MGLRLLVGEPGAGRGPRPTRRARRLRGGGARPRRPHPRGVLEEWTMMRSIADALSEAGHPVHTLPELRRNTATVKEAAALVATYLGATGLTDALIVAHSKGGLIAKCLLLGEEGHRVRRVVTVATPFSGSVLARLEPHPVVRARSCPRTTPSSSWPAATR